MLIDQFDSLLLDLDGVVYRGKQPIDGAVEAIGKARLLGKTVGYITNNASRTPEQIAEQLRGFGIELEASEVIGSAASAAKLLSSKISSGKILVVGGEGLRSEIRKLGFEVVDSASAEPVAVVQGFSPEVGWPQLAEAAFAIQTGQSGLPPIRIGLSRWRAVSHRVMERWLVLSTPQLAFSRNLPESHSDLFLIVHLKP